MITVISPSQLIKSTGSFLVGLQTPHSVDVAHISCTTQKKLMSSVFADKVWYELRMAFSVLVSDPNKKFASAQRITY